MQPDQQQQASGRWPWSEEDRFTAIRQNQFVELPYHELDDSEKRAMYVSLFSPCEW